MIPKNKTAAKAAQDKAKENRKIERRRAAPTPPEAVERVPVLTPKQQAFVDEYLIDLNGTQAAIRAGYSEKTARSVAAENLAKPYIALAISIRQQDRVKRVEASQDDVVRVLVNMLAADANDLVEYRRHCCRFCWGKGFKYQRTANEMAADRAAHERALLKQAANPDAEEGEIMPFDEAGGIGYDERKGPNDKCPECFGDGVGKTIIKDTRNLSPSARALYAGVKQTKEGIEVKMQSKESYLQLLMRHMGMLKDRTEITGKDGAPIQTESKVTLAPDEAYKRMLDGQ